MKIRIFLIIFMSKLLDINMIELSDFESLYKILRLE